MSRTPKTARRETQVTGVIFPDARYTTEGVLEAIGIGKVQLAEARRAGIVKVRHRGGRDYYSGADIIRWIDEGEGK